MKWIKENWILVYILSIYILSIVFIFFIISFFYNKNESSHQNEIKVFQSQNSQLKKQVAKGEIEIDKIRAEKDKIKTKYKFDMSTKQEIIQDLKNNPQVIVKTEIRYKTKVITKTSTQGQLWSFGLSLHNDFEKYVKLDIEEQKKSDKVISDLKSINVNSEKIIGFLKRELNKWSFGYGGHVGFGTNGFNASVGLNFSKRFKKIK